MIINSHFVENFRYRPFAYFQHFVWVSNCYPYKFFGISGLKSCRPLPTPTFGVPLGSYKRGSQKVLNFCILSSADYAQFYECLCRKDSFRILVQRNYMYCLSVRKLYIRCKSALYMNHKNTGIRVLGLRIYSVTSSLPVYRPFYYHQFYLSLLPV